MPRAVRAARSGREPDGSASLDNSWLREAGLELVDTPGLWGDDGREAAEAVSAALGADAVVLTVRAVGGADLQERGLLARLAAQPGGTVLLVVTMLDEVTGDRDAVMERYRRIAEAAGGTVEVFAGPGGDLVRPRWPGNLDALRARLTDLGAASGRRRTRDRRISAALSTVCDELEALADEALAPGGTGEARRTGDLEHRASLARWSVVRLEVSAERDRLRAQVVARVSALQTEILDEVEQRVAEHTDPKALWLDELAGELHSRMTGRIDEDESIIGAAFRRDVLRVAAELDAIAGPRPHLEVTGPAAAGDPALADGSGAFAEAAGRMRVFSAATIDTLGGLAERGGGAADRAAVRRGRPGRCASATAVAGGRGPAEGGGTADRAAAFGGPGRGPAGAGLLRRRVRPARRRPDRGPVRTADGGGGRAPRRLVGRPAGGLGPARAGGRRLAPAARRGPAPARGDHEGRRPDGPRRRGRGAMEPTGRFEDWTRWRARLIELFYRTREIARDLERAYGDDGDGLGVGGEGAGDEGGATGANAATGTTGSGTPRSRWPGRPSGSWSSATSAAARAP